MNTKQQSYDAALSALQEFEAQFAHATIPAGVESRNRKQAEAIAEANAISRLPENIAKTRILQDALHKAFVSLKRQKSAIAAAASRKTNPETAIRQAAQAELRKLGFAREITTGSGSNYYQNGNVKIRISNHHVPETAERRHNAKNGGFSWATMGRELILSECNSPEDAREQINELAAI